MKEKEEKKILLLLIQEKVVNGVIYAQREEGLEIIGLGEEQVWDGKTYDSFKVGVKKSLAGHLDKESVKISQTFFVLSPFWVVEGQKLMESKGELLKTLCREHSWPAGGFVIDDESLVFHFKDEGGEVPPSFISLLLSPEGFRLSLVHLGKVKKRLKLSTPILSAQKIREGLDQLSFEGILPPKFVIWGKIKPELEEEMLTYPWIDQKGDLFLHLPDIQTLDWSSLTVIFKKIVAAQLGQTKKEVFALTKGKEKVADLPIGFSFEDLAQKEMGIESVVEEKIKMKKVVEEEKRVKKRAGLFLKAGLLLVGGKFKGLVGRDQKGVVGWLIKGSILSLALLVVWGLFGLKREVVLYLTPKEIETENKVLLGVGTGVDAETLPIEELVVKQEAEGQEVATGTKLIGEKANGKVTVFNRTDRAAFFEQGTKILGPSRLAFVFQEEVKVASKTPDLVSGVDRWGEGEVLAEAAAIGSEYNLAADTIFTVENELENDYLVKNKQALAGGTSREITAVSDEDRMRLKQDLKDKLQKSVEKKLEEKAGSSQKLILETVRIEVVSFSTDKETDEEGDGFGGKLALQASGLAINQPDLAAFARVKLADQAPADYRLDLDSLEVEFLPTQERENGWLGKIRVKGKYYPQLDTEGLVSKLKGKSKSLVSEEVRKQPRVYRYELKTFPEFFSFFPLLPLLESKIKIRVEQ